jgi:sec1 family domain-containing protein 1
MASSYGAPTAAGGNNLRSAQIHSLLSMLHLNKPISTSSSTSRSPLSNTSTQQSNGSTSSSSSLIPTQLPTWKILIMDRTSQDILATSLRVQDLRENGVTLHLQLMSERSPLQDVPAVYFVEPKEENLRRIEQVSWSSIFALRSGRY